jgi:predicted CXXCH cytochrome family protein
VAVAPGRPIDLYRVIAWVIGGMMVIGLLAISITATTLPACTLCHSSATWVRDTAASAHADIACARCHVPPSIGSRLTFASRQVFGMTLRIAPAPGRAAAAVRNDICLSCHEAVLKGVASASGLRVNHSKCAKGLLCSDCHSGVAHGASVRWRRAADMDRCLRCHSPEAALSECDTCHAAKLERDRLGVGSWAVTHGANWKTAHGMGDWGTCGACHPKDYCVDCHGVALPHGRDYVTTHPVQAVAAPVACRSCHQDAFCSDCHRIEMPHPATFTPAHPALVKDKGDAVCVRCHDTTDCAECHVRHVHPGGAKRAPGGAP